MIGSERYLALLKVTNGEPIKISELFTENVNPISSLDYVGNGTLLYGYTERHSSHHRHNISETNRLAIVKVTKEADFYSISEDKSLDINSETAFLA